VRSCACSVGERRRGGGGEGGDEALGGLPAMPDVLVVARGWRGWEISRRQNSWLSVSPKCFTLPALRSRGRGFER
jgi:hypothetical protein